jgi:hypothetical protein
MRGMGINIHGARALCFARNLGADFSQAATIARQGVALSSRQLEATLEKFGRRAPSNEIEAMLSSGYAEGLLCHLGAESVHSFDVSPYEGATHIHDMNEQLPLKYNKNYSVVVDGGSLEHIFNVPVAIRNCMEMLKVGGHYISILPANNFFGHGFYQFSPEFFFNIFNQANGFEVVAMAAFNDRPDKAWRSAKPDATWYRVANPLELRERVTLANAAPISLVVIARRIASVPIFTTNPQQSDYAAIWRDAEVAKAALPVETQSSPRPWAIRIAKAIVPAPLRLFLRGAVQSRPKPIASGLGGRFFTPFDPANN